ncbi:MAG TPA: hypothetical protein VFA26_10165 [Gemmataceae bacterium]|nr:hypothetical protein [Gemmataceae bacterium]
MRHAWLALAGLLLAAAAPAQQAAPPAAPPATSLDTHLKNWEREMKNLNSLVLGDEKAPLTRTEKNKTFQYVDTFVGQARFLKPGYAILEMRKKDKPEVFEKFVCTGDFLYQYAPAQKQIRAHALPKPQPGQPGGDNFLSLLFDVKAADALKRFDLKLEKEDPYYVYVIIQPKNPQDKADFQKARVVLHKGTYLPRQLWFEQPNGDEVLWDIPRATANANLDRKEFTTPQVPTGWKMVEVPRGNSNVPPRVYRPSP